MLQNILKDVLFGMYNFSSINIYNWVCNLISFVCYRLETAPTQVQNSEAVIHFAVI